MNREEVIQVLRTVEDPELFLDIWFLGLVYNIDIQDDRVSIEMTFTSPMCPAGPMLIEQVKTKLTAAGAKEVAVNVVFNPPWTPPDEVKAMMGLD